MPTPHPTDTPQQQLVQAINAKYKTRVRVADVWFGMPVLLDQPIKEHPDSGSLLLNSSVQITSAEGVPYEFNTTLYLNRLSLAALFEKRSTQFAGSITHTHDLLPSLTSRLGFTVREEDIVGHTIENPSGYPLTVLLIAAPTSLLLFDQINITLTGP